MYLKLEEALKTSLIAHTDYGLDDKRILAIFNNLFVDEDSLKEYATKSEETPKQIAEAFARFNELQNQERNSLDIPLVMSDDFLHQQKTISLLYSFNHLNDEGKNIAVERIEELALIPKYQRKISSEPSKKAELTTANSKENSPEGKINSNDGT